MKTRICAIALLLGTAAVSAEELYRWVDKDGKVHFGDRPPLEARAEDIGGDLKPINAADATRTRKPSHSGQRDDLQQDYRDRKKRQQLQRRQKMAQACQKARRRLHSLQGRVAFVDQQGREVRLTERERQRMAEELQREIGRVCS